MVISDFCERDVVTMTLDSTLVEAAKLMRHYHVGYIVVVEERNKQVFPLGIVTDRDIVIEVIATELDPQTITVGDIMLQKLLVIRDDADIVKTIDLMTNEGVRRLPIVNEKGTLVGVATMEDMLIKTANLFESFNRLLAKERENELKHRP
jgi:predicted transcriptional regulator